MLRNEVGEAGAILDSSRARAGEVCACAWDCVGRLEWARTNGDFLLRYEVEEVGAILDTSPLSAAPSTTN